MSELSTRVWLDERLWDTVRRRAIAEGTTIRDLIPRLVHQSVNPVARVLTPTPAPMPAPVTPPASPVATVTADSGPPVMVLAELYRCGECGAEVRLGGVSNHMGRHLKERQAPQS